MEEGTVRTAGWLGGRQEGTAGTMMMMMMAGTAGTAGTVGGREEGTVGTACMRHAGEGTAGTVGGWEGGRKVRQAGWQAGTGRKE